MPGKPKSKTAQEHLLRVRNICAALPDTMEKLSHGEPTFFVNKKVFVMFSNNHHGDGRVAVMIPAGTGQQELMIADAPDVFYRPPYVGVRGWVGVELSMIGDEQLTSLIREAWRLIAQKRLKL
jgi:hypothetical protein